MDHRIFKRLRVGRALDPGEVNATFFRGCVIRIRKSHDRQDRFRLVAEPLLDNRLHHVRCGQQRLSVDGIFSRGQYPYAVAIDRLTPHQKKARHGETNWCFRKRCSDDSRKRIVRRRGWRHWPDMAIQDCYVRREHVSGVFICHRHRETRRLLAQPLLADFGEEFCAVT